MFNTFGFVALTGCILHLIVAISCNAMQYLALFRVKTERKWYCVIISFMYCIHKIKVMQKKRKKIYAMPSWSPSSSSSPLANDLLHSTHKQYFLLLSAVLFTSFFSIFLHCFSARISVSFSLYCTYFLWDFVYYNIFFLLQFMLLLLAVCCIYFILLFCILLCTRSVALCVLLV